ncbi:MAG: hypothetical protein IJ092_13490 [Atopobiaceae bacterium]|nr:hypothetical protein [Atopobiaceae bacterium]
MDEHGNIHVRITDTCCVLTKEEEAAAIAKFEALKCENAKLRELAQNLRRVIPADVVGVVIGANTDHPSHYRFDKAFRELEIEVSDE